MKKNLITLVVIIGATTLAVTMPRVRGQVSIPIEPVTVSQPVTVTQNITVSEVPVQSIRFDLVNESISFQLTPVAGGNRTITLTGAEFTAVRNSFLAPFSQAIAPTLRSKLAPSGD